MLETVRRILWNTLKFDENIMSLCLRFGKYYSKRMTLMISDHD